MCWQLEQVIGMHNICLWNQKDKIRKIIGSCLSVTQGVYLELRLLKRKNWTIQFMALRQNQGNSKRKKWMMTTGADDQEESRKEEVLRWYYMAQKWLYGVGQLADAFNAICKSVC